jgi:Flp pilus assembly protein TadG
MTSRRRRTRGQSMVEFALVAPLLLAIIMGMIDFGFFTELNASIANGARSGARYAAINPTAWDWNTTPAANTIEGQIRAYSNNASVKNDNAHISIDYYNITGAAAVHCGNYDQVGHAFTPAANQATCVVPGALIKVTVTYDYNPLTPIPILSGATVHITEVSSLLEEQ